jgi:hypothetical protein
MVLNTVLFTVISFIQEELQNLCAFWLINLVSNFVRSEFERDSKIFVSASANDNENDTMIIAIVLSTVETILWLQK